MARGLGGEDGPSLWMFVAVVLVWGKIQGWFGEVKADLSGNLANPLQDETTDQIRAKEKRVAATQVRLSTLPKSATYYQDLADDLYSEMQSWFNVDEEKLLDICKPLTKDELLAVYKAFGVKDNKVLGVAQSTGTLIDFFKKCLSDGLTGNDKTNMKAIWKKTGLWP